MVLVVVMGVSGCGKSTLAQRIARELEVLFIEGDSFHPQSNIQKMSKGIALNDDDRRPWLEILGHKLRQASKEQGAVLACSALKKQYRDLMRSFADGHLKFIYIYGEKSFLEKRMFQRKGHFMPVSLLETQLATLEDPTKENGVLKVEASEPQEVSVQKVINFLRSN